MAVYDDGHGYCFSCGGWFSPTQVEQGIDAESNHPLPSKPPKETLIDKGLLSVEIKSLNKRKLTEETCKKFGYGLGTLGDDAVQVAPYFNRKGELIAQKCRTKSKDFKFLGKPKEALLFGQHLWRDSGKKVVITEGEIDAMSVSQAQGNKWPVVSVQNGASGAKKSLMNQLEWLEQFEEVILMFDDDDAGRKAVEECVSIFTPGKVKVTHIEGFKDANEALVAGQQHRIIEAVWGAKTVKVDGVFTAGEVLDGHLPDVPKGSSWPWESLTEITHGQRVHEMYGYGAGTGIGKTDKFKEIMAHNIHVNGEKCGALLFEEPNLNLTLQTVAGKIDSTIYHVNRDPSLDTKMLATMDSLRDMLVLYQVGGSIDMQRLLTIIRYMVIAGECKHIFLDHITYLLDGVEGDKKQESMQTLMKGLNDLNKELPFCLHYISHLRKATNGRKPHEEGGRIYLDDFQGGKAATQYANLVIGWERDQQNPEEANQSDARILKDRFTGQATGRVIRLEYDPITGRSREAVDCPFGDAGLPSTQINEQEQEDF